MAGDLRIRPTDDLKEINGQMTRRWVGKTSRGVPVEIFVAFCRVRGEFTTAFEAEFPQLQERPAHPDDPTIPAPMSEERDRAGLVGADEVREAFMAGASAGRKPENNGLLDEAYVRWYEQEESRPRLERGLPFFGG